MKKYSKHIILFLIAYVFLYGFYLATSHGLARTQYLLQARRFVVVALVFVSTVGITQLACSWKPAALVGMLWFMATPVMYKLTHGMLEPFYSNHHDMVFGVYCFCILTLLAWLIEQKLQGAIKTLAKGVLALAEFLLALIPLWQVYYYVLYGSIISYNGMLAVVQTNLAEAIEYMQGLPWWLYAFEAIAYVGVIGFIYRENVNSGQLKACSSSKGVLAGALALCIGLLGYNFGKLFFNTYPIATYKDVHEYFVKITKYKTYHKEHLAELKVEARPVVNKPHTIFFVIGECCSRGLMQVYNPQHKEKNTPWLVSKLQDDNFTFFTNAYTSWGQTVPALERVLTEKNQYNNKKFEESFSIIDLARKAGYKTYWFSNQGMIGSADTPITLVANSTDLAKWTCNEKDMVQYDEALLQFLPLVKPEENNFVVLHLMGSHENYENRYPKERTIWGKENYDRLDGFNNSVAYTDYVLSQFFKYGQEKLNLAAMIYFADHGGVPRSRRLADVMPFDALQIPMITYFSPELLANNKELALAVKENKERCFTNDLLYDSVGSVLNLTSNHVTEENSLFSKKYKWQPQELKTLLGKARLSEDPALRKK